MTNKLIESFGFRSMIYAKYQSWGSFTMQLFSNDELRGEFDTLEFNFDTDFAIEDDIKFTKEDYSDDMSLDAAYFGRAIDHTIFHFPKITTLEKQLAHIKDMITPFFDETDKNKISQPVIIIHEISDTKINAYYIWQFK